MDPNTVESVNSYRICDEIVTADRALPECRPAPSVRHAVTIECEPSAAAMTYSDALSATLSAGSVVVPSADRLVVQPSIGTTDEAIRQLVLGMGIRLLFHRRGNLVFHASAIDIDGTAVAFLGGSGTGKSTTAAAFVDAGYDVLADDVVVVSDPSTPMVPRSFSAVKLDRSTGRAYGLETVDRDTAGGPRRRYHRTPAHFDNDACPVERMYLLAEGDAVAIDPLDSGDAVFELMRYSYSTYDSDGGDREVVSEHFHRCASLARSVDVRRLHRPPGLESLSDVVSAVTGDR